jgi:hypothetical protein
VLFGLAAFLGVLVLGLGTVGIFATHRIAGPAHVIQQWAAAVADGRLPSPRPLRHGDELQAAATELARMVEALRTREAKELAGLQNLLATLEGGRPLSLEQQTWLEQTIRVKKARLQVESDEEPGPVAPPKSA